MNANTWRNMGAALLLLAAGSGWGAQCDFLDPAPRPDWLVTQPVSPTRYYGVGAQEIGNLPAYEALKLAKQAAMSDLSGNIELTLKNEFTSSQQVTGSGSSEQVDRQIESVTRIVTGASLKEVEIQESWLDRKNCTLWLLATVTKSSVDALRNAERQRARLKELDGLISRAEDTGLSIETRQAQLGLAVAMLDEINFAVIDDGTGRPPYERKLGSLAAIVGADYQKAREAQGLLVEADAAASQARVAQSLKARVLFNQAAAKGYESVIGRFPFGTGREYWAELASFRAADLYKSMNDPCRAVQYYERVRDNSASREWSGKAQSVVGSTRCSAEDRSRSAWAAALSGQEYGLVCLYRANNRVQDWKNICDKLKDQVQRHGGVATVVSVDKARQGETFGKLKSGSARWEAYPNLIVAVADGELGSRVNRDNPGGADYQFKGAVATFVTRGGEVEFRDEFSGAGGWNPISRDMAMEVLGVIVYNRWQEKYGAMVGAK